MYLRRFGLTALAACLAASAAGCGLKARVRTLEGEVAEMKARVSTVESTLGRHEETMRELAATKQPVNLVEPASYAPPAQARRAAPNKPTTRDIQECLKNAGFSPGHADGRLGPQTKSAVKRFQKANGLKADGVLGPRTWGKLKYYY